MTTQKLAKGGAPLSKRECEILTYVAKGYTNPQIAAVAEITVPTVCDHLKTIYKKLEINSRAEAGVRACELGLHCTPAASLHPLPESLLCTLLVMSGHEPETSISKEVLHEFSNRLAAYVRAVRSEA